MPDFALECRHLATGNYPVAGVDEAGRGSWAGPLYVAMVVFSPDTIADPPQLISSINDSKQLSPKKRELLFETITSHASHWSYAAVSADIIDTQGLTAATRIGIERCMRAFAKPIAMLLLDGKCSFGVKTPCECHPKADSLSYSVAAASIVAKVLRDREMCKLAREYPLYHFEIHKGYGTALHREALMQHGPSPLHRQSYEPVRQSKLEKVLQMNTPQRL